VKKAEFSVLDTQTLKRFLDLAVKRLNGEWLLVGGTLLPAVGISHRSTVDIDFVGLTKAETSQNLELMELAEAMGLPVEAVNPAASFFVHKLGYNSRELLPLRESKSCRIYRPSCELYWKLKLARLTESDYQDCKQYYWYCTNNGDAVDVKKLKSLISTELATRKAKSTGADRRVRLKGLRDLIKE
jgi:hypothetical protein